MVIAGKISDELFSLEKLIIFSISVVLIGEKALIAVVRVTVAVEAVYHQGVLLRSFEGFFYLFVF